MLIKNCRIGTTVPIDVVKMFWRMYDRGASTVSQNQLFAVAMKHMSSSRHLEKLILFIRFNCKAVQIFVMTHEM